MDMLFQGKLETNKFLYKTPPCFGGVFRKCCVKLLKIYRKENDK